MTAGPRVLLVALCFLACDAEGPVPEEVVPRVKVVVLSEPANAATRQISGRVEPVDRAHLSFGVPGTVVEVRASVGDVVAQGQVLAQLDSDLYRTRQASARAQLISARSKSGERRADLERKETLLSKGFASVSEVGIARAGLEAARGGVKSAEAEVVAADRHLAQATISAPFAGRIARREIEPFSEVGAGQLAFELHGEGSLQVEVLVPETLIRDVDYGQPIVVSFPTLAGRELGGVVSEIAAAAGAANAFRVAVALEQGDLDLRPGMAANTTFVFGDSVEARSGFLIPISALALREAALLEPDGSGAPIYVFDEATSSVRLRRVKTGEARGNEIIVYEGLKAGDRVVVAGVAFLHDKMRVELWEPPR